MTERTGIDLHIRETPQSEAWATLHYSSLAAAKAVSNGILQNEGWEAVLVDTGTGIVWEVNGRRLTPNERYDYVPTAPAKAYRFTVWVKANDLEAATEAITSVVGFSDYDYDEDDN